MVFCSKCGHQIAAGVGFCPGCGAQAPGAAAASSGGAAPPSYRTANDASSTFVDYGPGYTGGYARRRAPGSSGSKIGKAGGAGANGAGGNGVNVSAVIQGVKRVYKEKILPMEAMFKFPDFHSPSLTDTDFEAKPMVLLMGQYSTGKTSFIRFMLERDFPGSHIGPEPTTDKFIAIMKGPEKIIPGNALAAQSDKPFTALTKFGMAFLNRFECSQCNSPILNKISFIDSPGVLSGEKQRINRGYDFTEVVSWFAERADRILMLFDAHKLDISDEFKSAIMTLKGHDDKIRCILNKADMVNKQSLIRVYGALMWSLGKVIQTPEVLRVYVGSFWDKPLKNQELKKLFDAEQADLLADLRSLPRNAVQRKVNELIKRSRMLKVHVEIISHMQGQFGTFGKAKTQDKMLKNLLDVFKKVQQATAMPMGDFPHLANFRETVGKFEIHKFPSLTNKKIKKLMVELDKALSVDIPKLMRLIPNDIGSEAAELAEAANPFALGSDSAAVNQPWAIDRPAKSKYDSIFHALDLVEGKLSGANAFTVLMKSQLPRHVLKQVWDLSDCDQDGYLDSDEFALAMHLIEAHKAGRLPEMPEHLPSPAVPPSKRDLFEFD